MPLIYARESLCPFYVSNVVFNVFFSYTAIMLNTVTIHALRRASSLAKPLKSLLLSLAVSDLGVGLLVQPHHWSSGSKKASPPFVEPKKHLLQPGRCSL